MISWAVYCWFDIKQLDFVSEFAIVFKFNLGRELKSAQRGIAFSTGSAVSVSILILIVGSGFHQDGATKAFSISQLGDFIFEFLGTFGVVIFSLGFIGAAFSSILTCPLAASLTADRGVRIDFFLCFVYIGFVSCYHVLVSRLCKKRGVLSVISWLFSLIFLTLILLNCIW